MGLVKNLPKATQGLDLWVKRVRYTFVEDYREIVWALFSRILVKTPQSTGRAVANWNIGIGAPDYSFNPKYGDARVAETVGTYQGGPKAGQAVVRLTPRHEQGARKWINSARARNKPKLALISAETKVYITNGAMGDDDDGKSSPFYVESLQDPNYWVAKLREINQPYETAEESVLFMAEQMGRLKGRSFKLGGDPTTGVE